MSGHRDKELQARADLIDEVRPQFEDGEAVVAAFAHLAGDTPKSKAAYLNATDAQRIGDHDGSGLEQVDAEFAQFEGQQERMLLMEHVELVFTDRRVFARGDVEGVFPRDQVRVKRAWILPKPVRFLALAIAVPALGHLNIVVADKEHKLKCNGVYRDDLGAVAASFGLRK